MVHILVLLTPMRNKEKHRGHSQKQEYF